MNVPEGFEFTDGTSIHTSSDPRPHLTGTLDGETVHLPYYGQTTLGMFDRDLGAHTVDEVQNLHDEFPDVFEDSGIRI
jgi:hypothetical protein